MFDLLLCGHLLGGAGEDLRVEFVDASYDLVSPFVKGYDILIELVWVQVRLIVIALFKHGSGRSYNIS